MIACHTETLAVDIDLKSVPHVELGKSEQNGLNGGGRFLSFAHPPLTRLIPKHVPKEIIQIHFKWESTLWESRKPRKPMTRRWLSAHAPRFIINAPLHLIRQDLACLGNLFEAFGIASFIRMMGAC